MDITHPLYDSVQFGGVHAALIDTVELARLKLIKQLSLVYLAFPGATNTRFMHSLGVAHIAGKIADHLGFSKLEKDIIQCAALLHDIGHGPFSHSLEEFRTDGITHESFAHDTILGKTKLKTIPGAGKISAILDDYNIPKEVVAKLVVEEYNEKPCLQQIISGPIDADKLDYLVADSKYTGCKHGVVDVDRVIRVMQIDDNKIKFKEDSGATIQQVRTARSNMLADVYIHRTPRIAEAMLKKAVEMSLEEIPNFHEYYDGKLSTRLEDSKVPKARELVKRIIYNEGGNNQRRNLYKAAYQIEKNNEDLIKKLEEKGNQKLETELYVLTLLEEGDVLVNFPKIHPIYSEEEFKKLGIEFVKDPKKKSNYALFEVYSSSENEEKVSKAVESLISSL